MNIGIFSCSLEYFCTINQVSCFYNVTISTRKPYAKNSICYVSKKEKLGVLCIITINTHNFLNMQKHLLWGPSLVWFLTATLFSINSIIGASSVITVVFFKAYSLGNLKKWICQQFCKQKLLCTQFPKM